MSAEAKMATSNINNVPTAPVGDIRVGHRHRGDLGDLAALAKSIKEVGLLHPLVVTPDLQLVAGARRLAAVKELGWESVPVRVVEGLSDALAALRAERDENTCRKDFTRTEAVALGKKLEELESAEAKKRQASGKSADGEGGGRGKKKPSGKLPEGLPATSGAGRSRDKVAGAVGVSGRTYEKMKAVGEAAEKEPEKYGDLARQMDATGNVDAAHKELKERGGAGAAKAKPYCKETPRRGADRRALRDLVEAGLLTSEEAAYVADHADEEGQMRLVESGHKRIRIWVEAGRWLDNLPLLCHPGMEFAWSPLSGVPFDPGAEASECARLVALCNLKATLWRVERLRDAITGWIAVLQEKLPPDGAAPERPSDAQEQPELFKDGEAA